MEGCTHHGSVGTAGTVAAVVSSDGGERLHNVTVELALQGVVFSCCGWWGVVVHFAHVTVG